MSRGDAPLGILLAIVAGWALFVVRLFPNLKTVAAPRGIVSLQLAFTTARARVVVDDWRTRERAKAAARSQLTDVAFIALYVTALALVAVLVAHATDARHPHRPILVVLSAGALDLAEDAGLLLMLRKDDHQAQPLPLLTGLAAAGKFVLLVLFAGLLVDEVVD